MSIEFSTEHKARAVMAFIFTLRDTAGLSDKEILHLLHPRLVRAVLKMRPTKENHE